MYKLIKYNLKLIFSYNCLAACLLICLTPAFFQLSNMNFSNLAKMGELYLSLSGIFLFIFLGSFEMHQRTLEFVYIKKKSYVKICFIRLLAIMIFNALIILLPISYAYINSNYINFFDGYFGFVVTTWFLGLLGLIVAELFNDYKIAYLISFAYYFIATSTKGIFRDFQVFGYTNGIMDTKEAVFICCLIMIFLYLIIVKIKYKRGI